MKYLSMRDMHTKIINVRIFIVGLILVFSMSVVMRKP